MKHWPFLALAGVASFCACSDEPAPSAPVDPCVRAPEDLPEPTRHTPRWAFEPWISKDISDGPDTYAFVKGFRDRDIPVGAVVLDSPWETNYNTFVPNPSRYPNFETMVSDMHADGVKVVLWITNFLNAVSYDLEKGGDAYEGAAEGYQQALDCGYFVEDGATFSWWKGTGGAIDFMNPSARAFFHERQNHVLDMGIDGWKIDFGDSYVRVDPVQTKLGPVPHQEYSEAYYRDFLAYGVKRRGPEFLTMVRAWDASYDFAGRFFAKKEHAPVAWMGDNRRDWFGLADALDEAFRSAVAGYVVVGSDIGGYLDRDDMDLLGPAIPFDPVVFARWTAASALSPFMQLHGRANITPWDVPQNGTEIVDVYRFWSKLHHELVPFFYSLAEEAYAGGAGIVRPIGEQASWADDYRYTLGDAFFVAPLVSASGKRDVALPAGARYWDFWSPAADPLEGGATVSADFSSDLQKIPLYLRAGAIVPMSVSDGVTGLGKTSSAGWLTVLVFPDAKTSSFALHDEDGQTTTIEASETATSATVTLSRAAMDTLLRVRAETKPASVSSGGNALAELADQAAFDGAKTGWLYDPAKRVLLVKIPKASEKVTVDVTKA